MDSQLGRFFILYRMAKGDCLLLKTAFSLETITAFTTTNSLKKAHLPEEVRDQIEGYFEGRVRDFNLRYSLTGTPFEMMVWEKLKEIPYGEIRTYQWLAREVGNPRGVRAVGQALGKNPLPVILPCHRIIQSDGKLGGYSSGVDIKRRLLDLEFYNSRG
ncbi:MAG: methylated-DNA--[protein]-cysteine S-methyltransferase [Nitrospirae bacterium]|nr:MAG: methylated-DNA--[protein]-cysteine S-methyltransferase [Nitrospirota bacterium]